MFVAVFVKSYGSMAPFTTLADATHKLVLFLSWLLPLYLQEPSRRMAKMSIMLACYQLGALAAMVLSEYVYVQFLAILACFVLLAFDIIELYTQWITLVEKAKQSPLDPATGLSGLSDLDSASGSSATALQYETMLFEVYLSERFNLTRRELEVESLLEKGCTTKEIAEALVISRDTAKTHRRNVMKKIGAHSADELSSILRDMYLGDFQKFLTLKNKSEETPPSE